MLYSTWWISAGGKVRLSSTSDLSYLQPPFPSPLDRLDTLKIGLGENLWCISLSAKISLFSDLGLEEEASQRRGSTCQTTDLGPPLHLPLQTEGLHWCQWSCVGTDLVWEEIQAEHLLSFLFSWDQWEGQAHDQRQLSLLNAHFNLRWGFIFMYTVHCWYFFSVFVLTIEKEPSLCCTNKRARCAG